ncbi:MAG: hypothetical protein ABI700_25570 [Chloroflexota bacterium]
MASDTLQPIRDAINAGDKKTAQVLLKPVLKDQPSADAWVLAAQACATEEKAIYCLRHALEIQPQHNAANRMLFKLEGMRPQAPMVEEMPPVEALTVEPLKKVVRRKKKRSATRTITLICLLILGVSLSTLTMNLAGLITGPITVITQLTGGATPVREIGGKPLSQVENAPLLVKPSQTKPLEGRDADVLEPGYEHEYTFAGSRGGDVAIYVQFLSVAANRVSRNVVLLRPDNSNGTSTCEKDAILQGDNNITLTCTLDTSGTWKVRILGREKESVGAYFVGVQQVNG